MKSIEREMISRETIKPSSPTPPHLRSHKLSLIDQFTPNLHVHFALFYPRPRDDAELLLKQLKKSLSQVLTLHYPFAGRFRDRIAVDCNDEGVEFVECRVNCELSEILKDPATCPEVFFSADLLKATPDLLLAIQVSVLGCQGIVIGVSFSHVVADASTICTFMTDWASKSAAHLSGEEEPIISPPQLIASSVFPPFDPFTMPELHLETKPNGVVAKRFVFDPSSIAALKEMTAAGSGVENPTRVELVTAFLLTCAVRASAAASGHVRRACVMQAVNLRRRMIPPLPSNSFGNMTSRFLVKTTSEEDEDAEFVVGKMVKKLRDSKEEFDKSQVLRTTGPAWIPYVLRAMQELAEEKDYLYIVTSWCGFGFYDVDLGWGKPIWLGVGTSLGGYKNTFTLTDTKMGDGIEAVVCLEEEEMALFEQDAQLMIQLKH